MGRLFFLALLSGTSVVSLAQPWVGVALAYLFVILVPQTVWFWNFEDIRPVFWVLIPTLIGFAVGLLRKEYDFTSIWNRRNLFLLTLWMSFTLSYYAGPYVDDMGPYRFTDPSGSASTLNKVFLLYFVGCLCIDSEKKLKVLVYVFVVSVAYLVYWANDQYLSGRSFGRLAGPTNADGVGAYADENNFAMLFVTMLPYLWYLGFFFKKLPIRLGLWLIIPLGWHAIFLTGSRGGLIGLAVTILLIAMRSRQQRLLGLLLIPAFIIAYQWQAGGLMKERAETISDYDTETSASSRLEAWSAALNMIVDHPLTGVGLASFGPAFPHYSEEKPREAHNTFLQITAESGILAGTMYVLIAVSSIVGLWRHGNRLREIKSETGANVLYLINEATLVALCGLLVCSAFLSLQVFEIFYCLCLVVNAVLYIGRKSGVDQHQVQMTQPTTVGPVR
jgi:probable O-glycosylation ligase (exosortase A-associated)